MWRLPPTWSDARLTDFYLRRRETLFDDLSPHFSRVGPEHGPSHDRFKLPSGRLVGEKFLPTKVHLPVRSVDRRETHLRFGPLWH